MHCLYVPAECLVVFSIVMNITYRPNTGLSQFDEEKTDLMHRYSPVSADKAGGSKGSVESKVSL